MPRPSLCPRRRSCPRSLLTRLPQPPNRHLCQLSLRHPLRRPPQHPPRHPLSPAQRWNRQSRRPCSPMRRHPLPLVAHQKRRMCRRYEQKLWSCGQPTRDVSPCSHRHLWPLHCLTVAAVVEERLAKVEGGAVSTAGQGVAPAQPGMLLSALRILSETEAEMEQEQQVRQPAGA